MNATIIQMEEISAKLILNTIPSFLRYPHFSPLARTCSSPSLPFIANKADILVRRENYITSEADALLVTLADVQVLEQSDKLDSSFGTKNNWQLINIHCNNSKITEFLSIFIIYFQKVLILTQPLQWTSILVPFVEHFIYICNRKGKFNEWHSESSMNDIFSLSMFNK